MKTNFITSAIVGASLLLTAASQAADPVFSVNMVGFQKVDVPSGQFVSAAAPFYAGGTNDLNTLVGDQLDPASTIILEEGGSFITYQYAGGIWERIFPPIPHTGDLLPGTSFIIDNSAGASNTFTIVGEVVQEAIVTNVMAAGFNLVSNPYSSDLDLNAANVTLKNVMPGTHKILLEEGGSFVEYQNVAGTIQRIFPPIPIAPIPSGKGFIYQNTGGGDVVWEQPSLY